MTRRERLEAKVAKREQWAAKATERSEAALNKAHAIASNIPFGQPILVGHHSEKRHRRDAERIRSGYDKGFEEADKAKHHAGKAHGLTAQLETSIYSDDVDADERLRERIAELQAKRDRMKAINAAHRKYLKDPASLDKSTLTDAERKAVRDYKPAYSWEPHPYPPYMFTNLGGNIRRLQKRLTEVAERKTATADAENSPTGYWIEGGEHVRVTFAEKPPREILDALKAAGFRWSRGSWHGERSKLPPNIGE